MPGNHRSCLSWLNLTSWIWHLQRPWLITLTSLTGDLFFFFFFFCTFNLNSASHRSKLPNCGQCHKNNSILEKGIALGIETLANGIAYHAASVRQKTYSFTMEHLKKHSKIWDQETYVESDTIHTGKSTFSTQPKTRKKDSDEIRTGQSELGILFWLCWKRGLSEIPMW